MGSVLGALEAESSSWGREGFREWVGVRQKRQRPQFEKEGFQKNARATTTSRVNTC